MNERTTCGGHLSTTDREHLTDHGGFGPNSCLTYEGSSDEESNSSSSSDGDAEKPKSKEDAKPDSVLEPWRVGIRLSDGPEDKDGSDDHDEDDHSSPDAELTEVFDYYSDMFRQAHEGDSDSDSDSDVDFDFESFDQMDSPHPVPEVVFDEVESRENLISVLNKGASSATNGASRKSKTVTFRTPLSEEDYDADEENVQEVKDDTELKDVGATEAVQPVAAENENQVVPSNYEISSVSEDNSSYVVPSSMHSAPISLFEALSSVSSPIAEAPKREEAAPVSPKARLSPKLKRSFQSEESEEFANILKAAKIKNRPSIDQVFNVESNANLGAALFTPKKEDNTSEAGPPDADEAPSLDSDVAPINIESALQTISSAIASNGLPDGELKETGLSNALSPEALSIFSEASVEDAVGNVSSNNFESTFLADKVEGFKSRQEEVLSTTQGAIQESAAKLEEAAENAAQDIQETVENVEEKLEEAGEDAKERLIQVAEKAGEAVKSRLQEEAPFKAFLLRALSVFICCYTTPSSYLW